LMQRRPSTSPEGVLSQTSQFAVVLDEASRQPFGSKSTQSSQSARAE
jgi:hypothetical protein